MTAAFQNIRQTMAIACLVGAAIGLMAAISGAVWQRMALPRYVWTVEQAEEFEKANSALHAAAAGDDDAEHEAAKRRFNRIAAELQSARYAKDRLGSLFIRGGLAAAAAFSVGYLAIRET
jgi:hypothetical protein